jgi:hypothetical protein
VLQRCYLLREQICDEKTADDSRKGPEMAPRNSPTSREEGKLRVEKE